MAFFSNSSEGMAFEEHVCSGCIHANGGCPVLFAHMMFPDDECLDTLIPEDQASCSMFYANPDAPSKPGDPILPGMEKIFTPDEQINQTVAELAISIHAIASSVKRSSRLSSLIQRVYSEIKSAADAEEKESNE